MFALALSLSFTLLLSSRCVTATLSASNTGPVVQLSYGSFQGNATADLEEFLGIPFAAPPYASYSFFACAYTDNYVLFLKRVGNLRFAHPEPPLTFAGVRQTTRFGAACPQQAMNISSIPGLGSRRASLPAPPSSESEDCRTDIYTYYLILF
jgi:acetylcholinesterase